MFDAPLKVHSFMRNFEPNWFVAGGWAIDLFLEGETRPHDDIEIVIYRKDQIALQNHLNGWLLRKAENYQLFNWEKGEFLQLPVHEIHCSDEKDDLPFLEVLLNETNDEDWLFRRDQNVTKPLSELFLISKIGVKFLCPEVVLLFKSKNPRDKDERDFQTALKSLDAKSRKWLKNALTICDAGHCWLEKL